MNVKLFPRDKVRLLFVQQMIDRDFKTQITIYQLVKLSGINESKLRNGFKQEYGVTPFDYISQKRLDYAVNLLQNTEMYIQEIAFDAGYKDISTFNRAFKDKYNMTPTAWRKYIKEADTFITHL